MEQRLATNQAMAGLPVSSSGQQVRVAVGTSTKLPKPTTTTRKPYPPKAKERRVTKEDDEPSQKGLRVTTLVRSN